MSTVALEKTGAVGTIRMNRPDRLNAYEFEMGKELLVITSYSIHYTKLYDPSSNVVGPGRRVGYTMSHATVPDAVSRLRRGVDLRLPEGAGKVRRKGRLPLRQARSRRTAGPARPDLFRRMEEDGRIRHRRPAGLSPDRAAPERDRPGYREAGSARRSARPGQRPSYNFV